MTPLEASAQDLIPLTEPYEPHQLYMARKVMADLARGGIQCALVQIGLRTEVWRKKPQSQRAPTKGPSLGYNMLRAK